MAAPDIVDVASMLGKTSGTSLSDTSATVVLNNAASSNKVLKAHTLLVSNDDGTNSATITLSYNSEDDGGGTAYKIAHTIAVPADSTIIVIDENSPIWLEEDRSLVATASAGGDLDVIVSYLEIDDA